MASEVSSRTPTIGALMLIGWLWVREQVLEGVCAAGYRDLTPAHIALVRRPTMDGLRPVEIAKRMHITRQSVHELLAHMEQQGYLRREADVSNGRAQIVRLTDTGRRLELEIRARAEAVEAQMAALIGEEHCTELRAGLLELAQEITT